MKLLHDTFKISDKEQWKFDEWGVGRSSIVYWKSQGHRAFYDSKRQRVTDWQGFRKAVRAAAAAGDGPVVLNDERDFRRLQDREGIWLDAMRCQQIMRDEVGRCGSWWWPHDPGALRYDDPENGPRLVRLYNMFLDVATVPAYHGDHRTLGQTVDNYLKRMAWVRDAHPGLPIITYFSPIVRMAHGPPPWRIITDAELDHLASVIKTAAPDYVEFWLHLRQNHLAGEQDRVDFAGDNTPERVERHQLHVVERVKEKLG